MADLVTLAQAQAFVEDTSSAGATWVQLALDAASQNVIDFLGVDPSQQQRAEFLSGRNVPFLIPRASGVPAPISGVTSINVLPTLTAPGLGPAAYGVASPSPPSSIDISGVSFDDDRIFFINGRVFPRGQKNIQLTYTSGYASIPASIQMGVLFTVKAIYTTLGKEMNATSESYAGVLSQGFNQGGPGAIPPAAQEKLSRYQVKVFAG